MGSPKTPEAYVSGEACRCDTGYLCQSCRDSLRETVNKIRKEDKALSDIREGLKKQAPSMLGGYPDNNPKTAMGAKKPGMNLTPSTALVELGIRMQHGADKYGAYNWREKSISVSVYVAAIARHNAAILDGEWVDPDCPYHTSHASAIMACGALLIDARWLGNLNDDRPRPAPTPELIRFFERNGRLPTNGELDNPNPEEGTP